MYLDDVLAAQKRGEARGIASVCSAHPRVIREALQTFAHPLIEATCNQVNQFGGYTGMRPRDFVAFVRVSAEEAGVPFERVLLGGDHLGPYVWRAASAGPAMHNAKAMVAEYAEAGFTKLHLDCSMPLADDPEEALAGELSARRAAELAQVAERCGGGGLRYVIGTEVPRPGGAAVREGKPHVTDIDDVRQTIELHCRAFHDLGLDAAWDRVVAVVVQPGVEFGDDFVLTYQPEIARQLSGFIDTQPMVYEAHSTDFQPRLALQNLVQDHFAILKVGPALTFAYREAMFALAMIEQELISPDEQSNLLGVLDGVMTAQSGHWREYYRGTERQQASKRKFSLSDRLRYYWTDPRVKRAVERLMHNLGEGVLPFALCSQFAGEPGLSAVDIIRSKLRRVMNDYRAACEGEG